MRLARRYRPGRTAKSILNGVGDVDVTQTGPDARIEVLRSVEANARIEIEIAGDQAGRRLKSRLETVERWLTMRTERRRHRNEVRADLISQGKLWRAAGIYEKAPHIELPSYARVLAYIFLAALDFYVFAEAWAVGADSTTGETDWWIGGFFGLVVFGAGFLAAVQAKRLIVGTRQRELLKELSSPHPGLVPLAQDWLVAGVATSFFLAMVILGFAVRTSSESSGYTLPMVILAALVPVLAALAEVFLHDPMDRKEAKPRLIDRILGRRKARIDRKLKIIEERRSKALQQVEAMYEVERQILGVEQHDLGIRR